MCLSSKMMVQHLKIDVGIAESVPFPVISTLTSCHWEEILYN